VIKEDQGTIGTKDFIAMLILALGGKMTDMSPTIIFQNTKNAGWMVPFISGLLFVGLYILFLKTLHKFPNDGLYEVIMKLFGNMFGKITIFILFLIAVTALTVDSRSHVDTIATMYFPQTPLIVMYIIFLGTSYFIARRGLATIGIVSYLVLPYLLCAIGILLLLVLKDISLYRTFPIFGPGIDVVMKESIMNVSLFSDTLFFALFIPFFREGVKYGNSAILGTGFSIVQITIYMFIYVALFDFIGVQRLMYPFHETTRFMSIGQYFTNTETFYLGIWLVGVIIKFAIYLFIVTLLFTKLVNIQQIRPMLLPFTSLAILIGMFPENPVENVLVIRETLLHITSFYLMALVISLWAMSLVKGGKVS
jgi:spore germination protein KB